MYNYDPAYENQLPPSPCDSCKEEVCKRRYRAEGWCAEWTEWYYGCHFIEQHRK